jgi:hypothetical protein
MSISIGALVLVAIVCGQDDQIKVLQEMVHELQEEVSELKNKKNEHWITKQRADEIQLLVQNILLDTDTRSALQGNNVTAGYDHGAFLTSTDGNWKLKINGQIQARWMYNDAEGQSSQHGFEQRRTKIKFSGHILDPSWTFKISSTWPRTGAAGSNTEDAWIAKKLDNGSWFKFGQFGSKFLREQMISSSAQLAVERSMVNHAFSYLWTQGIEFGWNNEDLRLTTQYTDGPGQSNTTALTDPTDAWNVRAEFRFGESSWKDFGYLTSRLGIKRGLLIGIAYENYSKSIGTHEYGNAKGNKNSGWTVDASLLGDGWNVFAYMVETAAKDGGEKQDSSGWLVQGGFLVSDNVELFTQYQKGKINNATFAQGSNDMSAIRIGFNYWPNAGNNSLKWTTDIAWSQDSLPNSSGSGISSANWLTTGNGWREDLSGEDSQMLLRTQLQVLF